MTTHLYPGACIFCNRHLGTNEALENFPVGRRLAFDPARGRLWAVCPHCERWNLTPLATRWEAIEEAERSFRATRMRVASDNIGLTQLAEGLELVRIGAPPLLELAGWRYGDQFGRRRRRHMLAAGGALVGATIGGFASLGIVTMVPGLIVAGGAGSLVHQAVVHWWIRQDTIAVRAIVRSNDGKPIPLTHNNMRSAALVPRGGGGSGEYELRINVRKNAAASLPQHERKPGITYPPPRAILHGTSAQRALATILPYINRGGGSARRIREAVDVIGAAPSVDKLLHSAATARQYTNDIPGENLVGGMQPHLRLALEMVLHDDDERRALDGQLAELEARWREAEEIASISDSLLVPEEIEERLAQMKAARGAG